MFTSEEAVAFSVPELPPCERASQQRCQAGGPGQQQRMLNNSKPTPRECQHPYETGYKGRKSKG